MSEDPATSDPHLAERQELARRVRIHREMLILALVVGICAPLLSVHSGDRVGWRWSSDLLLPPLCFLRQWCGIDCPGCGLTRSLVYLAHGDLAASWRMHRLGVLLACLVVLQIPYRLLSMRRPQRPLLPAIVTHWMVYILMALLILNWLYNLLA